MASITSSELLLDLRATLEGAISRGCSLSQLSRAARELLTEMANATSTEREPLVGVSVAMALIRTRIGQLSTRSRAPVFIWGEAGVGKRHVARALHRATYPEGRWLEVPVRQSGGELERSLASMHVASAGVAALGCTLYVPDLHELAVEAQALILRVLDAQPAQLRVIASSSRPRSDLTRLSKLHRDLLLRFSNELSLPCLWERKEDIAPLVADFCKRWALATGSADTIFSPEALALLCEHSWPANAAELRNVVERAANECGPGVVEASDLPPLGERLSGPVFTLPPSGIDLAELERELLIQALALADNNQTRAAALLGLTRDQIRYRMSKLDLLPVSVRAG